jgi:hypothetical protein
VDFVDDINLIFAFDRGVFDFIDQITDLVHAVIAGGVDFDDIRMGAFRNGEAVRAFVALMA